MVSGPYLDLSFPSLPPRHPHRDATISSILTSCIPLVYTTEHSTTHCIICIVPFCLSIFPQTALPIQYYIRTTPTELTQFAAPLLARTPLPPAPRIRHRPGGRPSRIWLDGAFRGNRHSEIGFPLLFATSSRRVSAF